MLGKIDCDGLTDPGRVRAANEDQFLIANLNKSLQVYRTSLDLDDQTRLFGSTQGQLLLVADGMGGHAAGKRASTLAVDSLANYVLNTLHWFFRLRADQEEVFTEDLKAALEYCQSKVRAEAERVPGEHGMGTTLTMAYLAWPKVFIVHAGDSRCYLLRGSRLRRMTRDHTVAQQLADEGVLDDPEDSPLSERLWNVIGGNSDQLVPEAYRAKLALGDSLLLCTDGLTKHVGEAEIGQILAADVPSTETCRQLVAAANAAGGTDNITVVVAHLREARQQQAVAGTTAVAKERNGKETTSAPEPAMALAQ